MIKLNYNNNNSSNNKIQNLWNVNNLKFRFKKNRLLNKNL